MKFKLEELLHDIDLGTVLENQMMLIEQKAEFSIFIDFILEKAQ